MFALGVELKELLKCVSPASGPPALSFTHIHEVETLTKDTPRLDPGR